MAEQEIGDHRLQALFKENGAVWTVDKNRAGVPRIHVTFPVPDDLKSQTTHCPGCGKVAKISLVTLERAFRPEEVILLYDNVQHYTVSGCELEKLMDEAADDEIIRKIIDGVDCPEMQLYGSCIQGKRPLGIGNKQKEIMAEVTLFVSDRLTKYSNRLKLVLAEVLQEELSYSDA